MVRFLTTSHLQTDCHQRHHLASNLLSRCFQPTYTCAYSDALPRRGVLACAPVSFDLYWPGHCRQLDTSDLGRKFTVGYFWVPHELDIFAILQNCLS